MASIGEYEKDGRAMSGSKRAYYVVEAALAVALVLWGGHWITSAAAALGLVLPAMPLLRRTYLAFGLTLLVLFWVKARGERWADFGITIPKNWITYVGFGIALTLASIALDSAFRSIATPLIVKWTGADPHLDAKTFAAVKGNLPAYLIVLPNVWVFGGFGEESFFRGYLMTRFNQIFGGGKLGWALAVICQAAVFGGAHGYQGPVGMAAIFVGAILTGSATLLWKRNLVPAMVMHGLTDTIGFTMLYLGMPL